MNMMDHREYGNEGKEDMKTSERSEDVLVTAIPGVRVVREVFPDGTVKEYNPTEDYLKTLIEEFDNKNPLLTNR